jgi:hypothetical protein
MLPDYAARFITADSFGIHVLERVSPVMTFCTVGFFFTKSALANRKPAA